MSKTEKIKQFLLTKKTVVLIALAILPLVYLFFVIYLYVFAAKAGPSEQKSEKLIDRKLYEDTMENFRQRELNFSQEAEKTYIEPFSR